MANKEKYAVLVEDYCSKEEAIVAMTRQNANEEFGQVDNKDLTVKVRRPPQGSSSRIELASKHKKGRCRQRLPDCVPWPLLLAVSLTFLFILLTFHLWFTWHLHRKVVAIQTRIESLSTLDLEELRSQLRYLYDLCEDNTAIRDGLSGDFANSDQVKKLEETLLADIGDGVSEKKDESAETTLFSSKQTILEPSRVIEVDDFAEDDDNEDEGTRSKRILKSGHEMKVEKRRKRQADLSSHTQDGVPIFERGYGVTLNRTEGLRIYQSLLANGGRVDSRTSEASNVQATEAPIQQHHHRQNSWRSGRKEKSRHRHQSKLSTTSPLSDDLFELSPNAEFDATSSDHQDLHRSTSSAPSRNGNVEFRHSRVKTSPDNQPLSAVQGDQKPWSTTRTNGMPGVLPMGAPLHTSALQEERISAATAPAILTKTVTASVGPSASSSNRARQQPNIFKVTQPALISRSQADNAEDSSRDSPSPSTNNRRKINKKQLRDLSHTATAIHLVADTRNVSSANMENQVEIASRNELGLHTSWKIAMNDWDSPLKTTPLVKIDGAILTVKQSGLYFIYAQVHYLDDHSTNAYEVFINTEPFLRCVTSAYSESSFPKANTCYTAAATHLREGDKIFLRDIEPLRYSVLQPSKTFLGLIRMAPIADFS